jgi:GAF domain-containing protein
MISLVIICSHLLIASLLPPASLLLTLLFGTTIILGIKVNPHSKKKSDDDEVAKLKQQLEDIQNELHARTEELAVINKVQEGLATKVDIQSIYDLVGEKIREIFDAQVVSIGSYDYKSQKCHFKYDIEKGNRFYDEPRTFNGIDKNLIKHKKTILINKNFMQGMVDLGMPNPEPAPGTEMPKSAVWVPLVVTGITKGYVSLQNVDRENAFAESDVNLLTTLANSMSVALENANGYDKTNKLLEETKQQAIELTIINTVGEGLAQQLDFQAIIDLVGEKIRDVFQAQVVSISTYDKRTDTIFHRYVFEMDQRYYFDKPQPIDADRKEIIVTKKPLVFGTKEEIIKHSGGWIIAGELPESFMGVPIILNQEASGVITVQDLNKTNLYKENDVQLLMTLSSNMGVALENARLFEETNRLLNETQQRNAELAIINSVGEAMSKQLDVPTVTRIVGDKVKDIFKAEATEILLLDNETKMINVPYSYYQGYQTVKPFALGEGMTSEVILSGKPLVVGSLDEQRKHGAITDESMGEADLTESYMAVPIIVGKKTLGVVSVQSYKQNAFDDKSVLLLSTLSSNMGVALENARLFEETNTLLDETKQRNAELGVINSVQEGLVAKMEMNSIYELVGDKIRNIFDAQVVMIASFDHDKEIENINFLLEKGTRYYPERRPIDKLRKHLIKTHQSILINENAEAAATEYGIHVIPGTGFPKSLLVVPLIINGRVNSYITLQNIDKENAFSESDVRLLTTLANSMSVALENARLFDETNRLLNETKQRNAELGVINSVQEGLVAQMNMQSIYDMVGNKIRDLFDAQVVVIRTYDSVNELVNFNYVIEKSERFYPKGMPFDNFTRHLTDFHKPILINENFIEEIQKFKGKASVEGEVPKSAVYVPMIVGGKVIGNVSLQNVDRENAFNESDVRLLTTLTNSMSVALENARLFAETNRLLHETQQRNTELSILNAIQQGLVMEMDFQAIIELVGDKLREALDFQDIGIRLYNKEKKLLEFPYEYERGERLTIEPMPPTATSQYVMKNKKVLLLRKNGEEELRKLGVEGMMVIPGTEWSKSLIAVPIILADEARGLIIVENYEKEDAFSESDVGLLTTLANSMSVALENARLFDETNHLLQETRQRAAELSTVNSISKALAAHLELDKLINLVGEKLRDLFKANMAYVALSDKKNNMINFPYGYGDEFPPLPLGEGMTSQIILKGEPLLINREIDAATAQMGIKRQGLPSTSYLGVPIPVGNEIIGAISVQSTEQENRFSEDDMRLLSTIAANVGVAINNAEAYRQLNVTVERLNATLRDLKSMQQQLVTQEKLASLGQLTAGIAHEIKNPLNFVNNFAEVSMDLVAELKENINNVRDKIPGDKVDDILELMKDLEENSQRINQHGKRADSIVRSMLQHSRGKAGDRQDSDINAMLEEDLNLAYHGMRARDTSFNITIEKDFDENLQKISVVPQDISRVFLNIINNGFYEANKKKKNLNGEFSPLLKVSTKDFKDRIEVHIQDNGNGIPLEVRDKLFNPFFTTKPTGEGTGLGLSLSHDIVVKQHEGEIRFETESGKFTEFIISLPRNHK